MFYLEPIADFYVIHIIIGSISDKSNKSLASYKGFSMPDIHCTACKKVTPHKSLMRRSQEAPSTFTQKCAHFITHVAKGKHYYHMESQHFCRGCNSQNIMTETSLTPPVNTTTQMGAL